MSKRKSEHLSVQSDGSARRPVTAHAVARLAGVSQSAVSRTFTAGASVADATRHKVMDAARQLGYRPNLVARSLITGRSKIIGVTVPSLSNQFYSAVLESLSDSFAQIGYRVMLFTTSPDHDSDPVLEEILRYRVDALVLVSSSLSSHFADECQQIGLPVVLLNRKTNSKTVSSVTGENREGAEQIAAFLIAGGHRRFAYIAGLESSSTSRDREKGFSDYLKSRGYRAPVRLVGNYTVEGAVAATRTLLSNKDRPDAIFCANDRMALAAINVVRTEFNLEVGRDVSVVGFDNTELAEWPVFGLTTYSQPVQPMVDRIVHIVSETLINREMPPAQKVVQGHLIVRDSARIPEYGISILNGTRIWSGT
jgi:DNA-binding LacI/PurR family transcriptional regulator